MDLGLTLETPGFKLFTVANLPYQLSWWHLITLLYSPTDAAQQFLWKQLPPLFMNTYASTTQVTKAVYQPQMHANMSRIIQPMTTTNINDC